MDLSRMLALQAYKGMIALVCQSVLDREPDDDLIVGALRALAGIVSTWTVVPEISLDDLSQVYASEATKYLDSAAEVLDIVELTAPSHPLSFAAIYQIADAAARRGDAETVERAFAVAVEYLKISRKDAATLASRYEELVRQWLNDPRPTFREIGSRIKDNFKQ